MKTLNTGFDTLYAGVGKVSGVYDAAFEFGSGSLALIEGAQALCAGIQTNWKMRFFLLCRRRRAACKQLYRNR